MSFIRCSEQNRASRRDSFMIMRKNFMCIWWGESVFGPRTLAGIVAMRWDFGVVRKLCPTIIYGHWPFLQFNPESRPLIYRRTRGNAA